MDLREIIERYFDDPTGWEKRYNELEKSEVTSDVPEPARPNPPSGSGAGLVEARG